jgi:hypothetical protein
MAEPTTPRVQRTSITQMAVVGGGTIKVTDYMPTTLAVFHAPILALKAVAPWIMLRMVDTLAVFHEPMLPLKAGACCEVQQLRHVFRHQF